MSDDDSRTVRIGPTKRRERHDIARQIREPNKIIVRFLSVLEEVMTKYAHRPLFQLLSLGEKLRPCFEIVCFSSLTRRQFVSGSHVGCMSTHTILFWF
jgi:hypothetical protein